MRAFVGEVITRLPDLEPAGPVSRLQSNFQNGIKHLPVTWRPQVRNPG
jgi:cytochrome P450